MKVKLDKGAFLPERAHPWDAGMDLRTPIGFNVYPFDAKLVDTGVHVQIPEGYVGLVMTKSSINVRGMQTDGVIDSHYTGSIKVNVVNRTENKPTFKAGDKIAQLVIVPVLLSELEVVDRLENTERGDGGFGSTGR